MCSAGCRAARMTGAASFRRKRFKRMLEETHLNVLKQQGVAFDPLGWDWRLSSDMDVNYMIVAERPRALPTQL